MLCRTLPAVAVLAVMTLLAGCATPSQQTSGPTLEDQFVHRWVGKTEDDVFVRYGRPTDVIPLARGTHVDGFHTELNNAESEGVVAALSSSSPRQFCDRRFEVDQKGMVVGASISGNSCDYAR